ncbi:uncharacterized protein N7529_004785 [Penicillium soppii]|uniref:uncharacterized protein n=1 Tax=Penicillium soppii TaxID=69789 RepID=UPI002546684F|nr:uncharacterized protein N7529_004785 [Penicillium soppii]KAJ5872432.1 hypothetical protein N7529_004785 [Penicillium soppii]
MECDQQDPQTQGEDSKDIKEEFITEECKDEVQTDETVDAEREKKQQRRAEGESKRKLKEEKKKMVTSAT